MGEGQPDSARLPTESVTQYRFLQRHTDIVIKLVDRLRQYGQMSGRPMVSA
jgi:hypothetical protein